MNKKLKNILMLAGVLSVGLVSLNSVPSFADDAGGAAPTKPDRPRRGNRLQGILDQLNLTDAQKTQVKTILDEQKAKRQALRQGNGDEATKRQQSRDLMKETTDKIRAILTEEQQKKFDELMAQQRAEHKKPQQ